MFHLRYFNIHNLYMYKNVIAIGLILFKKVRSDLFLFGLCIINITIGMILVSFLFMMLVLLRLVSAARRPMHFPSVCDRSFSATHWNREVLH